MKNQNKGVLALTLVAVIGYVLLGVNSLQKSKLEKKLEQSITPESASLMDIDGDEDPEIIIGGGNKKVYFTKYKNSYLDYHLVSRKTLSEFEEINRKKAYKKLLELADRNHDGGVDFSEQADAWRRMDYDDVYTASDFPEPSFERIKRGIKSYEEGK